MSEATSVEEAVARLQAIGFDAKLKTHAGKLRIFIGIDGRQVQLPIAFENSNSPVPSDKSMILYGEIATLDEIETGWLLRVSTGMLGVEISFGSLDEAIQGVSAWYKDADELGDLSLSVDQAIQQLTAKGFKSEPAQAFHILGGLGSRGEMTSESKSFGIIRHGGYLVTILPGENEWQCITSAYRSLAEAVQQVISFYQ